MKYHCNACGQYIEAGDGHSCYEPISPRVDPKDARIVELEKALRYYRDEYTGNEPSVSVFERMVDRLIGSAG
jgi:hypothetical protein